MYEGLMVLNTVVWLGFVIDFVRRRETSVFHPAAIYLFVHGLVFVLRPPLVYYRGYDTIYRTYGFTPTIEDKSTVLIGATIGLVAFMLASYQGGRAPLRFQFDKFDIAYRRSLFYPAIAVALLLVPLGAYSLIESWQRRLTAYNSKVLDTATGVFTNTDTIGYLTDVQFVLGPITALFAWIFRFRLPALIPFAMFIVARAGTGGRGPVMAAIALAGLLYLYDRRQRFPTVRVMLLGLLAITAFSSIGADRGRSIRLLFVDDDRSVEYLYNQTAGRRFLEGMDFANLEFYEYLVYAIPQRTGTYGYFLNNLQIFTEPIPRKLWPEKPIGPPIQLYSLFDYGYPIGMTNSLPGEGWAQLGYLGVVLWCALIGFATGAYHRWFMHSRQSTLIVFTYAVVASQYFTFFRDGLLLTLLRTGLFFMLPIILLYWMMRALGMPSADDLATQAAAMAIRRHRAAQVQGAQATAATAEDATEEAAVPRSRRHDDDGQLVRRAWRKSGAVPKA